MGVRQSVVTRLVRQPGYKRHPGSGLDFTSSHPAHLCWTSIFLTALSLFFSLSALADKPLTIYTVNYPLQYFAQRIAGNQAKVVFPAPPDLDPAFWQPEPPVIREYQKADMILLNGAGYAGWIQKVSLPGLRTVDTAAGFKDRLIAATGKVSHSRGAGGGHAHTGIAFTTWLDLSLAVRQARTIAEALKRRRPGSLDLFEKNMHLLERDLLELDSRMMQIVARNPDQPLVASHPVYQYLARAYGLNIKSVSWEPGQYPEPEQWTRLERLLERHPAGWMIWEAKPYPGSVRRLHDLGISSLVFNPVPNRPDEGDFMEVMGRNLDYLEQAYKP